MKAHPHAESIKQFAEDAQVSETPWDRWEYMVDGGEWEPVVYPPPWDPATQYRRRPGPAETEPLTEGTDYFTPCPTLDDWYRAHTWGRTLADRLRLERGLVYLNEQDAVIRAKEWVA